MPQPKPVAVAPPVPERRGKKKRHSRSRSRSHGRRGRRDRRRSRSRSGHVGRGRRRSPSHSSRSGSSSGSASADDAGVQYNGTFFSGSRLPRGCRRYGNLPPKIVYECCYILAPKKWSIPAISGSPDYGKPSHAKEHLQAVLKLMGMNEEGRIPTSLRSAPPLFFEIFAKQKARVNKALKDMEEPAPGAAGPAPGAADPAPGAAAPAPALPPGMLPIMDRPRPDSQGGGTASGQEAASGPEGQSDAFIKAHGR